MKKILVVDDDPADLRLITHILVKARYDVATAASGAEGIAKAEALAPDLIIMDILMPAMDGIEAYSRIKANPATENIPVLFLTAVLTKKEEELGANIEESFFHVLAKPVAAGELLDRVKSIVGDQKPFQNP